MKQSNSLRIEDIDAFVLDFDGVMTDNRVHLDQSGREWVSCNRADGLAFDVLHKLNKPVFILSTEKNPVVAARAEKLKVPALQGVADKASAIRGLVCSEGFSTERILFVGNDLNDYRAMEQCGYTACPSDSHLRIMQVADYVLRSEGGKGVMRELLEDVLELDFIEILYPQ